MKQALRCALLFTLSIFISDISFAKGQELQRIYNTKSYKAYHKSKMQSKTKIVAKENVNDDNHYIDLMISRHKEVINMANDALKQAKKPELKRLAEKIIVTQENEIAHLEKLYKKSYNR